MATQRTLVLARGTRGSPLIPWLGKAGLIRSRKLKKLREPGALGLKTPLKLSKRYGASLYSTIRRYVSTNHRVCAVLVLDPPELKAGNGFVSNLRRVIASPSFKSVVGDVEWAETFTPDDEIKRIHSHWAEKCPVRARSGS